MDIAEIQRLKRDYYKQLYANKVDNQEEIEKNGPVTSAEIETVIKTLATNKCPGPDGFTSEFYEHLETLTSILLRLFQEMAEEGTLSNSFYEATITLDTKSDEDTTKKENSRPVSLMNIAAKILNKTLANRI